MLKDQLPCITTETVPGPKAKELLKLRQEYVPNAVGCIYPCVMERAEGAIIEDVDGNYFMVCLIL